jgi:PAS domain S-box-containing protein
MFKRAYEYLFPKEKQDIRAFRIIILAAVVNFLIFSTFEHHIRGNDSHVLRNINICESFIFLVIFIISFFVKNNQKNINTLAFTGAYVINFVNIILTYLSSFEDRFAYQYLVYYLVISLYFISYRRFLSFQLINFTVFILLLIVSTHANSSDYSDYYITALTVYILIFIISSINNSRRKENEERDAKYKLLAENSSDIVSIQDYKGTILYVSPSIKEQAGYEQTDLIGKNVLKIINKISYSEIERYNNDLQNKTIEKNAYLFYLLNKDNSYDWYEFKIKLVDEKQVLLNSRKVTRRIENQNLLNDRTNELEARNQDLMTFSFIAAHDMKEPLRMIIIYQKMLQKKIADSNEHIKEYIDTTLKAAENMHELVSNLFSYTKLHDHKLKYENVAISVLVNNIKNKLQLYLEERNSLILIDDDIEITTDKQMLELVLQNIILNGLKYNKSETPTIKISIENSEKNTIISVVDNGIGIDEKYLDKIFVAFARLNKTEYSGTGLGLTISQKIINKLNGEIKIESKIDTGSKFSIVLNK